MFYIAFLNIIDVYTFEKYAGCMQTLRFVWNIVRCIVAYCKLW